MTTDEFYRAICKFIKTKTGLEAIWANQQARNPNIGKPTPTGASARDLRKYVLLQPTTTKTHSIHKVPDLTDIMGTKQIDMIPMIIGFTVQGIECKSDELRPVWAAFIREDFKTSISEDWSILTVGNIMYSPLYEKAEWKPRYLFECRALIYDWFKDDTTVPIEAIQGSYTLHIPGGDLTVTGELNVP